MTRSLITLLAVLACSSPAFSQPGITGKLLDQDGKPMAVADVHIKNAMDDTTLLSVHVLPDGSFSMRFPGEGVFRLEFSGVNHMSRSLPFLAERGSTTAVNVRLGAYGYLEDLSGVQFAEFRSDNSPGGTYTPVKQPDGTYVAEIRTDLPAFRYEVKGVERTGHTINGTLSETFQYDDGGDYCSVLTPKNGIVKVVFDPAKLVRGMEQSNVEFADADRAAARLPKFFDESDARQQEYMTAYRTFAAGNKEHAPFSYDWNPVVAGIQDRLKGESDPVIRQELWLECLDLLPFGWRPADRSTKDRALREIPPGSALWAFHINTLSFLANDTTGGKEYTETLLKEQRDPGVKGTLLMSRLAVARYAGNRDEAKAVYERLMAECAGTRWTRMAKERFGPDLKVFVGARAPRFRFVSLDDTSKTFSNETFKGKVLLIDFWAVWCGPCVAEMANLHKAYEKFKGDGFAVLSLSFDAAPGDVRKFRDTRWKMPWNHAFVEKGFDNPTSREFEVEGIPKPILVDATGTIVAMTTQLRGENLQKTLEKYLGTRP